MLAVWFRQLLKPPQAGTEPQPWVPSRREAHDERPSGRLGCPPRPGSAHSRDGGSLEKSKKCPLRLIFPLLKS